MTFIVGVYYIIVHDELSLLKMIICHTENYNNLKFSGSDNIYGEA